MVTRGQRGYWPWMERNPGVQEVGAIEVRSSLPFPFIIQWSILSYVFREEYVLAMVLSCCGCHAFVSLEEKYRRSQPTRPVPMSIVGPYLTQTNY
mmetsp:Transcript_11167/g.30818  ORF Transcript_11167/g.30818 Transcript_11167/m.30818 type:complete len:95 (+) Transcript_11167:2236-2520(+)